MMPDRWQVKVHDALRPVRLGLAEECLKWKQQQQWVVDRRWARSKDECGYVEEMFSVPTAGQ